MKRPPVHAWRRQLLRGLWLLPFVCQADSRQWEHSSESIALLQDREIIWRLHFGKDLSKPFLDPLRPVGRPNLVWNAPPDHPWHHGLWFSWKYLNGINYWEEGRSTGRSQGTTSWKDPEIDTRTDGSARISFDLRYQHENNPVILREKRMLTFSPPDVEGGYRIDWTATFTSGASGVTLDRTPLPGEANGKSYGGYAGLSVRFTGALKDPQVVTDQGPGTPDKLHLSCAHYLSYSGQIGGRDAGISVLDHPDNLNAPTPWYVTTGKMKYFSPAVLGAGSHRLEPGEHFTLRYRILVHPHRPTPTQLSAAYKAFAASPPPPEP